MDQNDVVETIRAFIATQFPRDCRNCGKRYDSLGDYLRNTTHVGQPVSYDAEAGDWRPEEPLGTISAANCSCGSTLVIGSRDMDRSTLWRLMAWARETCKTRGIDMGALLADIRDEIDRRTLRDEDRTSPDTGHSGT